MAVDAADVDYLRGMKTAFEIVSGIAVGILVFAAAVFLVGCAPCLQQLGSCGKRELYYDRCRRAVIMRSADGAFLNVTPRRKFDMTTPLPERWRGKELAPALLQECKE